MVSPQKSLMEKLELKKLPYKLAILILILIPSIKKFVRS